MKITSVLATRDLQNFTLSCRQRIITPRSFLARGSRKSNHRNDKSRILAERVKSLGDLRRTSIFIEKPSNVRSFVSVRRCFFFLKVNFNETNITIKALHTESRKLFLR